MALPLDQYLLPVSTHPPCGENEYDYRDLGGILSATLESIIGDFDGGMVSGEKAPQGTGDWSGLLAEVGAYLGRTKHLGLARFALIADLHLSGLAGFADGILLFNQLLARYWDDVHPRIEDGDAGERLESITLIEDPLVLKGIGELVVAKGKRAGIYTLNQVIASKAGGEPSSTLVEASINETLSDDPEFFDRLISQSREVRQQLGFLKDTIQEHLGSQPVTFRAVEERLSQLEAFISQTAVGSGTIPMENSDATGAVIVAPPAESASGEIRNRADVCRLLEQIIRFYRKTEPTSPVPHLISRVKKVVNMDFMEIVEEFRLSGNPAIQDVFGQLEKDS